MNLPNYPTQVRSFQPPTTNQLTRSNLKTYFDNTWELYELLFSALQSDSIFYLQPDPLRNPLIFYYGHTAAFYINKLRLAGLIHQGVHDRWDHLFAVGVDPDQPEQLDVASAWPTVDQVQEYRKKIYEIVHGVIDQAEWDDPIGPNDPLWALLMGLEHDRIHFETSSVLIRQLEIDQVACPAEWVYGPTFGETTDPEWIKMPGGKVQLGKPDDAPIFGWDNEYGSLEIEVSPFMATKNLVTNAEYWDFVAADGYRNSDYWTEEGWKWRTRTNTQSPKFWVARQGSYLYRAMFDEMPMPMDWPVEVNAHEAEAYCCWKNDGSRLLSEAEFNWIAQEGRQDSDDPAFMDLYNLNFAYGSPTPVGFMKSGQTASGFNDIYGNVWDWLQDHFYPLPGFEPHPLYEEFSAPYMDEEHGMMAGGAWATTGTGASKYYRLWFRRHFFQHAGFRLAKDL